MVIMMTISNVIAIILFSWTAIIIGCGASHDAMQCNHGHSGPPPPPPLPASGDTPLPRVRPPPAQRTFASPAVERALARLVDGDKKWILPDLATLFYNCLPNTLDTTVWSAPKNGTSATTFLSTGDIPAMWLRDSQNQALPYLRFAKQEPDGIGALIRGLIARHVDSVLADPYANSFSFSPADIACDADAWLKDNTTKLDRSGDRVDGMSIPVHQRKWEMDSLASVLRLARMYYEATGDAQPLGKRFLDATRLIVATYRAMQQPLTADNFTKVNYTFKTLTTEPKDTSPHGIGRGHRWTGMIRTSFLPSDDSPRFNYHIPGNAFAAAELSKMAAILSNVTRSAKDLVADMYALSGDINAGIERHGIVMHASGKRVYAMEVDGFGNFFFADDANPPSLLSLPLIANIDVSDEVYTNTRKLILSSDTNPFYYGSSDIRSDDIGGVGSEDASGNAGLGHVWGLSLVIRLLTIDGSSPSARDEAAWILKGIVKSSGGTGLMHESFWYNDPSRYTRYWFAMANSYLGEGILSVAESHPEWLFR